MGINGNFMQAHNNFTLVWGNDSTGLYRAYPATMTIQDQTLFLPRSFYQLHFQKWY